MMFVKAHDGDGVWRIFEADRVEFLGQGNMIHLDVEAEAERMWWCGDDRFPDGAQQQHVILRGKPFTAEPADPEEPREFWLVRWVQWFDPETAPRVECHLLVTTEAVYLCNDRGDTIEALR